jgi:hypothetical protein
VRRDFTVRSLAYDWHLGRPLTQIVGLEVRL